MAPEQIEMRWRDYGPWTDLYALGCLAYYLVAGQPPFQRVTPGKIMKAQLEASVPPLVTHHRMPGGFEAWLRRLLHKNPRKRFRRAADAAWALLCLPEDEVPAAKLMPFGSVDTSTTITLSTIEAALLIDGSRAMIDRLDAVMPIVSPPFPDTWQRPDPPTTNVRLAGVGLSLFGMRNVPVVARERDRSRLWASMRQVQAQKRARLAVLSGPAGCGKSRIADWLCERAHEVGAAIVLKAVHAPLPGPGDGLGPMVARYLRAQDMDADSALARVQRLASAWGVTDYDEMETLAEVINPTGSQVAGGAGGRHAVVYKLLRTVSAERPVVVWLDDAQWGLDALGFASYVMDIQAWAPAPVLVVITARDDVRTDTAEHTVLMALQDRLECDWLALDPLSAEDTETLIADELGLAPDLTAHLRPIVAGNPLFAVQLIGDWARRGVLTAGDEGFSLRDDSVEVPSDLPGVWRARLDGLLADRAPDDRIALELAAVLGQVGVPVELEAVCAGRGITQSTDLVNALMAHGLARAVQSDTVGVDWRFVHSTLVTALIDQAQSANRLEAHHAICAEALQEGAGRDTQQRVGYHRLMAGELEGALEPLLAGAQEALVGGSERNAERRVDQREEALATLEIGPEDPRWGQGGLIWARAVYLQGRFEEANDRAETLVTAARQYGWSEVLPVALCILGEVRFRRGDARGSEAPLNEAITLATARDDAAVRGRARRELSQAVQARGDATAAIDLARQARADCERAGDLVGAGRARVIESFAHRQSKAWAAAQTVLDEALELFKDTGYLRGVSRCHNQLGEIARLQGNVAEAERHYLECVTLCRTTGLSELAVVEVNLALTLLAQGRYEAAGEAVANSLETVLRQDRAHIVACIRAVLLVVHAARGRWSDFDEQFDDLETRLAKIGFVEMDIALCARSAGSTAARAGDDPRGARAFRLAEAQFRALGLTREADEVAGRIVDGH